MEDLQKEQKTPISNKQQDDWFRSYLEEKHKAELAESRLNALLDLISKK